MGENYADESTWCYFVFFTTNCNEIKLSFIQHYTNSSLCWDKIPFKFRQVFDKLQLYYQLTLKNSALEKKLLLLYSKSNNKCLVASHANCYAFLSFKTVSLKAENFNPIWFIQYSPMDRSSWTEHWDLVLTRWAWYIPQHWPEHINLNTVKFITWQMDAKHIITVTGTHSVFHQVFHIYQYVRNYTNYSSVSCEEPKSSSSEPCGCAGQSVRALNKWSQSCLFDARIGH